MKVTFTSKIEIDEEHLKVLLDYHGGYDLNDEYFNLTDRQEIEKEMLWESGLLQSGFYHHYPLSPSQLGSFILEQYLNRISPESEKEKWMLDVRRILVAFKINSDAFMKAHAENLENHFAQKLTPAAAVREETKKDLDNVNSWE